MNDQYIIYIYIIIIIICSSSRPISNSYYCYTV